LTIAQIAQKIEFPTEEAKKAFIERPYTPDDPLLIILPKTAEAWAQLLDMQQILVSYTITTFLVRERFNNFSELFIHHNNQRT
jgi:hypothetical protein